MSKFVIEYWMNYAKTNVLIYCDQNIHQNIQDDALNFLKQACVFIDYGLVQHIITKVSEIEKLNEQLEMFGCVLKESSQSKAHRAQFAFKNEFTA